MDIEIRAVQPSDENAWRDLWTGYLTFYETAVSQEVYDTTFARLVSGAPNEFRGLLALDDGNPVGLAHFLSHRHCWRIEDVVYLQDLFVSPEARGRGVGRALIEAVYTIADAEGTPSVYWVTAADNATARRLYDRIATAPGFVKYQR